MKHHVVRELFLLSLICLSAITQATESWKKALLNFDAPTMQSLLDNGLINRLKLCSPDALHEGFAKSSSKTISERRQVLEIYGKHCDINELDSNDEHIFLSAKSFEEFELLLSLGADPFARIISWDKETFIYEKLDLGAATKELFIEAQDKILLSKEQLEKIPLCALCKKKAVHQPVFLKGQLCHLSCVINQNLDWPVQVSSKEEILEKIRRLVPERKLEPSSLADVLKKGVLSLKDLSQLRKEGVDCINFCYEQNFSRESLSTSSSDEEDYDSDEDSDDDEGVRIGSVSFLTWLLQNRQNYEKLLWQVLCDPETDLNYLNGYGQTLLMISIILGHKDVFNFLIRPKRKVMLNKQDYINSSTALHFAAKSNKKEYVKKLLKTKVNLRLKNRDGLTAYALAVAVGATDAIDEFIDRNAQAFLFADKDSPVRVAIKIDDLATFQKMVGNRKLESRKYLECLSAAAIRHNSEIFRHLLPLIGLAQGCLNAMNTVFGLAIEGSQIENIKFLLVHNFLNIYKSQPNKMLHLGNFYLVSY